MGARYQVVAECAHVVVVDHSGVKATHLLYKGAFLPGEVDPDRLKFLVDGGFVAQEGDVPVAPNAAVEQDPARGLDSVTPEILAGEKPSAPATSTSDVAAKVADVVTGEGSIDKAAGPPRKASDGTELEARRAAARAKLPEGGAAPDGRASKDVWVEYLVARGSRYEDVASVDKDELQKLAKQQQS